jgi:hypothetical protein
MLPSDLSQFGHSVMVSSLVNLGHCVSSLPQSQELTVDNTEGKHCAKYVAFILFTYLFRGTRV